MWTPTVLPVKSHLRHLKQAMNLSTIHWNKTHYSMEHDHCSIATHRNQRSINQILINKNQRLIKPLTGVVFFFCFFFTTANRSANCSMSAVVKWIWWSINFIALLPGAIWLERAARTGSICSHLLPLFGTAPLASSASFGRALETRQYGSM